MDFNQIGIALLVVLFLVVSLAMILVVLIQRPQGGGLSGAFGAGGGGQSAFGARTGDALTISTIVVFVLFMGIAIALNFAVRPPEPTLPVAGGVDEPAPAPTLDLDAETPSAPDENPTGGEIVPTEAPGDGESVPAPVDPDGTEDGPAGGQ
jgi:preprotein translocase subunit SecG